jgi:hypothetical protein
MSRDIGLGLYIPQYRNIAYFLGCGLQLPRKVGALEVTNKLTHISSLGRGVDEYLVYGECHTPCTIKRSLGAALNEKQFAMSDVCCPVTSKIVPSYA